MTHLFKNKIAEFDNKYGERPFYIVLRFTLKILFKLTKFAFIGIAMFIAIFILKVDQNDHYSSDDSGAENRSPDDIWKTTSGNDYYDKEPPAPFS